MWEIWSIKCGVNPSRKPTSASCNCSTKLTILNIASQNDHRTQKHTDIMTGNHCSETFRSGRRHVFFNHWFLFLALSKVGQRVPHLDPKPSHQETGFEEISRSSAATPLECHDVASNYLTKAGLTNVGLTTNWYLWGWVGKVFGCP